MIWIFLAFGVLLMLALYLDADRRDWRRAAQYYLDMDIKRTRYEIDSSRITYWESRAKAAEKTLHKVSGKRRKRRN